jgi:protein SCO1/2
MWSFVTSGPDDLQRFGASFGVSLMPGESGETEIIHNLRTAVIDPEGRLTTIFGGNDWRAADLLKELRRAAGIT